MSGLDDGADGDVLLGQARKPDPREKQEPERIPGAWKGLVEIGEDSGADLTLDWYVDART